MAQADRQEVEPMATKRCRVSRSASVPASTEGLFLVGCGANHVDTADFRELWRTHGPNWCRRQTDPQESWGWLVFGDPAELEALH